MDGFTIIDAIVAAIVLLSGLLAYSRGLVREVLAIAGWAGAAVVAFLLAPTAEPLVRQIPVIDSFISDTCEISMVLAFSGVFAISLIVVGVFTPLFSSLVQRSAVGGIDQGLGFFFGVLRGLLLVGVAFFVYDTVVEGEPISIVDQSRSQIVFAQLTDRIADQNPEQALSWIEAHFNALTGACEA
jgi:membrane protein required for colicin V production